jgi:1-acyl-sn-glycerol-3-phosphate acyltransferase
MRRFLTPIVYWGATWFTQLVLLPLYTRIRVAGRENVPPTGPVIIASNHLSDVDPGILCTRIHRRIVYMVKIELFRVPVLAQFLRAFGAFPVKRQEADLSALRRSSETLQAGMALCIFPEGTRAGPAEQLREAWPGAGLVALRYEAAILPVAITGTGSLAMPRMFLHLGKRQEVTLTIGEPFYLPKLGRINAEAAKEGSRLIMERIAALLPEDHRGVYATQPEAVVEQP